MADRTMKQHDTWPVLAFTLSDAVGPVSLTGATVKLLMKGATVLVTGTCTPDPDQVANKGKGTYTWIAADTATPDTYKTEFEVTYPSGKVETFPNTGYLSIIIEADLG